MESLLTMLIAVLVVALIAGVVYYLIGAAPFIPPQLKAPLQWVVVAVAVLWLLFYFVRAVDGEAAMPDLDTRRDVPAHLA